MVVVILIITSLNSIINLDVFIIFISTKTDDDHHHDLALTPQELVL